MLTTTLLLTTMLASPQTQLIARNVEYQLSDNRTTFQGFLVTDRKWTSPRPGVLIVHQWGGITDHERTVARRLAEMGYAAFCVDVYGKGIRPTEQAERAKLSNQFKADRASFRRNMLAALDEFRRWPEVDKGRVAAIGYCFGGTGVLEMARAGMPLVGVVSFHGGLDNPDPSSAKNITCPVLVLHGADDPLVPKSQLDAFKAEMSEAGKEFELVAFPGAVHSFTQKEAGDDPSRGIAYNADADRKSWAKMAEFLRRVFR